MRHALHPLPYRGRRTVGFRYGPSVVDSLFSDLVRQFDELPVLKGEWTETGLTLTVDLPGVAAESVSVTVADRLLTVAVDEIGWKRSLRLRPNLDTESVTARHVNGRLTITIGTVPAAEARTISIDTTAPAVEAIEASSDEADAGESADTASTES
jgi:HSP20 family molecular chaperone IbpA